MTLTDRVTAIIEFLKVLPDKLTAIANAIRSVTGKTDEMTLEQMAEEASNIKTLADFIDLRGGLEELFGSLGDMVTLPEGLLNFSYTSGETSTVQMFQYCTSLTTVPLFDTSSVTDMGHMFQRCTSLTTVPLFDTSSVTDMAYMFNACTNLTTVPLFDTSSVTNMGNMLSGCTSLTTVPLFDTSSVTEMNSMLSGCTSLTTVPLFDTSNVTNMSTMFDNCTGLTTVPLFDTSNVTNMSYMLESCTGLTTVPLFDTSSVTNIRGMFRWCTLTTVPLFDTSSVTNMGNMFEECYNLTTVPSLDARNVTNMYNVVYRCYKLTDIRLRNIKSSITVSGSYYDYHDSQYYPYGHLLTIDSLLFLIGELRETTSLNTLTISTTNIAKLADIYVKTVEITDDMRAEDDLIDEKYPFEVCESTNEGAMTINDYVSLKNWQIK